MDITPDTTLDESTKSREFFEPWHPEVGQRVRVRLSGECRRPLHPEAPARAEGGVEYGHPEEFDGAIGRVSDALKVYGLIAGFDYIQEVLDWNAKYGHYYNVEMEMPWPGGWSDGCFAAIELEPIDE